MKALVYHGPGERGWDGSQDPGIIDPTDIVVRVDTTTICGTDLHILKGDVPETTPGTISATRQSAPCRRSGAGVTTVAVRRSRAASRASAPAAAAATARRAATASAWAAAAGSSATPSTVSRPSTRGCRSPSNSGLQDPRRADRRAGPVPGGHPPDLLRGGRPQRHGVARGRRRDRRRRPDRARRDPHSAAVHAGQDRRDRHSGQTAASGAALRSRRCHQQRANSIA